MEKTEWPRLEKGKYYECKSAKFGGRNFKIGKRYKATGAITIMDGDNIPAKFYLHEFNETFHSTAYDTSGETLLPPPPPNTQNLPRDASIKPQTIAEEAYEIIGGDRLDEYGDMRKSFENIGKVWSVLVGVEISPEKVALMMVGLKMVRQNNKHKRDNLVDLIGYTALLGKLEGEE